MVNSIKTISSDGVEYRHIKTGLLHREDGPATESKSAYNERSWYINGVRHRIDGPAVKYHFHHTNAYWYLYGKPICATYFNDEYKQTLLLIRYLHETNAS